MIKVQHDSFDLAAELKALRAGRTDVGGIAIFVGSVRDFSDAKGVSALTLEHYPGMTEQALAEIELTARARWPLQDVLIIHRHGTLEPGDDIVLVITLSAHREAAFASCQFLMDWLKTKAPFWKLEAGPDGADWVDAKDSDEAAAARWSTET
jgi:molybdopterin synthase catalytic subunit